MPLSIRIISSPDGESISQWNYAFPEQGGGIGRAFGSTMQLSDANREVSGVHAVIRRSAQGYQIRDESTNGLFINGLESPLGKGNQVTLNDGDVLNIGRYRLLVSCFVPALAKAQRPSDHNMSGAPLFEDDPFKAEVDSGSSDIALPCEDTIPYNIMSFDVPGEVEGDPFRCEEKVARGERKVALDLHFNTDEDMPLAGDIFQASPSQTGRDAFVPSENLPIEQQATKSLHSCLNTNNESAASAPSSAPPTNDALGARIADKRIDSAMKLALAQLLDQISPQKMEDMFENLAGNLLWSRKTRYWEMYKRYFDLQLDSGELQAKFQAYFQEALQQQTHNDGNLS
ncbi:FHA domain-containing protein [Vibrio sp. S4M6]|uniref:type VI secretion system-associated FHA domain protein n=1 Tax=Vibrio sinus TaxID=2946865 RepID=UPI00202A68BA|nr:FHA domain-containing protein [Vibrio sinus]MCL9781229.1 FHA domain-containing protein [Vibrio sinus]